MSDKEKNDKFTADLLKKAMERVPPPPPKVKDGEIIFPGLGSLCFVNPDTILK
jgi:hypothetical protein